MDAAEVREFARDAGYTVGARGRLSVAVVEAFLATKAPAEVRSIAAAVGVEVPARGRLNDTHITNVAAAFR